MRALASSAPARDWGAALLAIAMDLHSLPHAIDVVGIAAGEGLRRAAVGGVDHEDRADRSLAVLADQRPGGHYVDVIVTGIVEMLAVGAVEFGAYRHGTDAVGGVDHEQHGRPRSSPAGGAQSSRSRARTRLPI